MLIESTRDIISYEKCEIVYEFSFFYYLEHRNFGYGKGFYLGISLIDGLIKTVFYCTFSNILLFFEF